LPHCQQGYEIYPAAHRAYGVFANGAVPSRSRCLLGGRSLGKGRRACSVILKMALLRRCCVRGFWRQRICMRCHHLMERMYLNQHFYPPFSKPTRPILRRSRRIFVPNNGLAEVCALLNFYLMVIAACKAMAVYFFTANTQNAHFLFNPFPAHCIARTLRAVIPDFLGTLHLAKVLTLRLNPWARGTTMLLKRASISYTFSLRKLE
jgi:hypothetical protein